MEPTHIKQKQRWKLIVFLFYYDELQLLAPHFKPFFVFFLLWPLKVLIKQTRQAACAVKQSILLRCLWS